jgi:hypothetical protein
MDIVTYMMHIVIYIMPVMDIVIYMSCIWFLGIFGREKQKKIKKNWSICRAPWGRRTANRPKRAARIVPLPCAVVAHGTLTILCRAPRHQTHGKGQGQPCALTTLCRAPCHVAHGKEYYRSRACSAAHGREGVTPSPRGRPSTPFLCRASPITHGNGLCRALPFPKAHDKVLYRVKMSRTPFAVRFGKMRTAKSAIPVVTRLLGGFVVARVITCDYR